MPGTRRIEFNPENIIDLLTHYSDGKVPLGARLISVGVHSLLGREIGLVLASDQWKDSKLPGQDAYAPLYVSYEGKKIMTWGTRDGNDITWADAPVDDGGIVL